MNNIQCPFNLYSKVHSYPTSITVNYYYCKCCSKNLHKCFCYPPKTRMTIPTLICHLQAIQRFTVPWFLRGSGSLTPEGTANHASILCSRHCGRFSPRPQRQTLQTSVVLFLPLPSPTSQMTQQLARSGYRKRDAPSTPNRPQVSRPLALEAGLQVCRAAAGGAGGGREPRVRTGGGRSRRAASPLPGSLQRGRWRGAPGAPMGTERGGAGTTQVSPARGLPLHRVPLSHDPARHPLPLAQPQLRCTFPSPKEPSLHPEPVLRALLSPRGWEKKGERERSKQMRRKAGRRTAR